MACHGCGDPQTYQGLCGRCNYMRQSQPQYYAPPPPQTYIQQVPMMVPFPMPIMRKPPFNHTAHAIIDIVTCGAWLPFHIILWLCH